MATQAAVFHQELSQCILHKSMLCIQHSLSGRQHGALCWHKPSRLSPAQPPHECPGFCFYSAGHYCLYCQGALIKTIRRSDCSGKRCCRVLPSLSGRASQALPHHLLITSTRPLASSSGEQPAHAQHPLVSTPTLGSHLTVQHAE